MKGWIPIVAVFASACTPRLYSSTFGQEWEWIPPENSWPSSAPPENLLGEGYFVGQTVPEIRLDDQFGAEVSLWQFSGDVILLDISAVWCRPCQELAAGTQKTQDKYAEEGFTYVTVLQQNLESDPPTTEELVEWADAFGITAPILGDLAEPQTDDAVVNGTLPVVLLIDRSLTVVERLSTDEEEIDAAIEEIL